MVDRDPSLETFYEENETGPSHILRTRSSLTPLIGFSSPLHQNKSISQVAFSTGAFIHNEKRESFKKPDKSNSDLVIFYYMFIMFYVVYVCGLII